MDTNQLIKALADAATAAKPAQEYCLFWVDWWPMCMTKAEWSGWMQALGSVIALGIAIALPVWQKRNADAENFARARQCMLMLLGQIDVLREIAKGPIGERGRGVLAAESQANNLLQLFAEIRPSQLSLAQLAIWRTASVTAEQLVELIANVKASTISESDIPSVLELLMESALEKYQGFGDRPGAKPKS